MEDKSTMVTAPPPPSEVKIRTMRSDLESMRSSGGGMPKFQNVTVSGLSIEKGYRPSPQASPLPPPMQATSPNPASAPVTPTPIPVVAAATESSTPAQPQASERVFTTPTPTVSEPLHSAEPSNNLGPILIVTLVAILAIAGVGYFAYITFFK